MEPGGRYDVVIVGAGLTGLALGVMLVEDGQHVAIVEARTVGAAASGHTTAKISLLQGTVLSRLRDRYGAEISSAYVAGNRAGQDWLLAFLARHGVSHQRRNAITYAVSDHGESLVWQEAEAAREAGVPAEWTTTTELPFEVRGAVELPDQAQVQPMEMLAGLARHFIRQGGRLFTGSRVHSVTRGATNAVQTSGGNILAGRVVLATGGPVLDHGGRSSRLSAERSYVIALRSPLGSVPPQQLYLSAEQPTRSLRSLPWARDGYLILGGNGHPVGRQAQPPSRAVKELREWADIQFPGFEPTHWWSAQDYRTVGALPLVGAISPLRRHVLAATGYNKWGMTNAVAAAIRLRAMINDDPAPAWADILQGATNVRRTAISATQFGLRTALTAGAGALRLFTRSSELGEGSGRVRLERGRPIAESRVDGVPHRVSAICPHLGGIVRWNDAERSWDCPLHGSRFSPGGVLLEGPATSNLDEPDAEVSG